MENNKICLFAPCYNENNIIEWIDYHLKCGFDYIIIYDDQSTISVKSILENYNKFSKDKYLILENFTRQYFSSKDNTGTNLPGFSIRSDYFFNKLKPYIKNFTYCLSIDIDEYLYLGKFKNIHELVKNYEPFDHLYLNWRTFRGIEKYCKQNLIENFLYSTELEMTGKGLAKISSIISQTSPHCFDPPTNVIFYPNENYNFINKDIFNNYFELSDNSGLNKVSLDYFFENVKKYPNIPYIAHYKCQSIETFLTRRIIDRSILLKNNNYFNENIKKNICSMFFGSKKSYDSIMNNTFWGVTNPNIKNAIEYIFNNKDDNILNYHEDGSIKFDTLEDICKIYWNTKPNLGELNLDIYNFYKS